jgi:hypothetical protein
MSNVEGELDPVGDEDESNSDFRLIARSLTDYLVELIVMESSKNCQNRFQDLPEKLIKA